MSERYDVAIIGAGLGGLSTGIRLQAAGRRVLLLERLDRVGGLCGTVDEGGRQYVIACNDFGSGLRTDLAELGVGFEFETTRSRILYQGRPYLLPPDLATIARLLPHGAAIVRHVLGLRRAGRNGYQGSAFLAPHLERLGIGGATADLLMLPAYLMGVSPDRFRVDALVHEFRHDYGYAKPLTPVGGPQRFADALLGRFRELGGTVRLGTDVHETRAPGVLSTSTGDVLADRVVSTLAQPGHYRAEFEKGLPLTMLWLRLDPGYPLPAGIHTHVHFPPAIAAWFRALYDGQLPPAFGFHFFASDLGIQAGSRTANLYFYLPRDREEDEAVQRRAMDYILGRIDHLLPGLTAALQEVRLVSPGSFVRRHGIAPLVTPVIAPAGYPDATNYRADLGAYFAGAASFPPGDHAGAAIRSSRHVSDLLLEHSGNPHAS